MNIKKINENNVDDFEWMRNTSIELPKNKNDIDYFIGWSFLWDPTRKRGEWGYNGREWIIDKTDDHSVYYVDRKTGGDNDVSIRSFLGNIVDGSWALVSPDGILLDPIHNRTYNRNLNESNELDWIKDIDPESPYNLYVGMKFKILPPLPNDVIYQIKELTELHMGISWIEIGTNYVSSIKYPLKNYFSFADEGRIEIVYDNLIESEGDDFEWMRNGGEVPLKDFKDFGFNPKDIIGFKVRMSEDSYFWGSENNPSDVIGLIDQVFIGRDLMFQVKWPNEYGNSYTNSYSWKDLIVISQENNLNESDEDGLEWIRESQPNPFIENDYAVVFINNEDVTREEIELLITLLKNAGANSISWKHLLNMVLKYSKQSLNAYVKYYKDGAGNKRVSYGRNKSSLIDLMWDDVYEVKDYVEYTLEDITKNLLNLNESEKDEWDWVRDHSFNRSYWEPVIGDTVICIPGFDRSSFSNWYGGAAYKEGKIFTIKKIDKDRDPEKWVFWSEEFENGVYKKATEPYITDY